MSSALAMLAGALDSLRIPYLIGGSLASAAHGVLRATLGVDILAGVAAGQAEALCAALGDGWYADAAEIRRALGAGRATPLEMEVLGQRTVCPVASAEDILPAKLQWYRAGGEVSQRRRCSTGRWRPSRPGSKAPRESQAERCSGRLESGAGDSGLRRAGRLCLRRRGPLAFPGKQLVELDHAHLPDTDPRDVKAPASGVHIVGVGKLHADFDGFVVLVEEETDLVQFDEFGVGGTHQPVGGFFGDGVFPADVRQFHLNFRLSDGAAVCKSGAGAGYRAGRTPAIARWMAARNNSRSAGVGNPRTQTRGFSKPRTPGSRPQLMPWLWRKHTYSPENQPRLRRRSKRR